jgi:hypothetical protein
MLGVRKEGDEKKARLDMIALFWGRDVIRAEQRLRVTRRRKSQVRMIDVKKREVDMIDRYLGSLGLLSPGMMPSQPG